MKSSCIAGKRMNMTFPKKTLLKWLQDKCVAAWAHLCICCFFLECMNKMGIEGDKDPNIELLASSMYSGNYPLARGRLNNLNNAWVAKTSKILIIL